MKKSVFALTILSLFSVVTSLTGCSSGTSKVDYDENNFLPNGTEENPYQIVKEPVTIKIFAPHSAGQPEYKDLKMFKKLSEVTNLQFDFVTPDSAAYNTRRTTVWEDKSYKPDIFLYANPVGEQVQSAEYGYKMFVPLNDDNFKDVNGIKIGNIIDNYMPTFKGLLDKNFNIDIEKENCKEIITISNDEIYAFPSVKDVGRDLTYKMFINNVWIKNVYKKNPNSYCKLHEIDDASKIETIEDYVGVLKDFKQYDANNNGVASDEVPLSSVKMEYLRNVILSSYGHVTQYIEITNDGSKFEFVPKTNGYRDYLIMANDMWKAGLMDNGTFSNSSTNSFASYGQAGTLGSFAAAAPYLVTGQKDDKNNKDPDGNYYRLDKEYAVVKPLLSSKYNEKRIQWNFGFFQASGATLYYGTPYARECARLIDIMYSDLGVQLLAYGEEGVDWHWDTREDGTVCDGSLETDTWTFDVPETWTKTQEDYRATITPNVGSGACIYWANYFVGKMNDDVITDLNRMSETYRPYLKTPEPQEYKFTSEEYDQLDLIKAQIVLNLPNLEQQFVKGDKNPTSDADWNKFVSDMDSFATSPLGQKYETIYNTMLARYKK